jgi:hypothetical protein
LTEAVDKARGLATEGKLDEALRLLQRGPENSHSLRESFLWRMAMARAAEEAGKPRLALPIWEALLREIERFELEAWEPEICIPVLHALYRTCKADKEKKDQAEQYFGRLCRVDASAALKLE